MQDNVSKEIEWEKDWNKQPRGHWLEVKNQRECLDHFARNHGIKTPEDWKKVTAAHLKDISFFLNIYDASLMKMLPKVYPG